MSAATNWTKQMQMAMPSNSRTIASNFHGLSDNMPKRIAFREGVTMEKTAAWIRENCHAVQFVPRSFPGGNRHPQVRPRWGKHPLVRKIVVWESFTIKFRKSKTKLNGIVGQPVISR